MAGGTNASYCVAGSQVNEKTGSGCHGREGPSGYCNHGALPVLLGPRGVACAVFQIGAQGDLCQAPISRAFASKLLNLRLIRHRPNLSHCEQAVCHTDVKRAFNRPVPAPSTSQVPFVASQRRKPLVFYVLSLATRKQATCVIFGWNPSGF